MLGCFWYFESPDQQPGGEKDDLERCDGKSKDRPVAPWCHIDKTEPASNTPHHHHSIADQTHHRDTSRNESEPEQHPGKECRDHALSSAHYAMQPDQLDQL